MIGSLRDRVALVTGGGVRIGAAVSRALDAAGARVVIHARNSRREAEALAATLRDAVVVTADLSSEAACFGLVDDALRAAGRLDVLVNSAAVFNKGGLRTADMSRTLAEFWPNFFAPMQLMRAFAARCDEGRIVNILDRRVFGHDVSCAPYVLSKKALAELTQLAALELAPSFVVNAVAPGPVLPPPGRDEDYLRERGGRVPLNRRPTPEDIAATVLFLATCSAVTGQIVCCDGGQHLLGEGV